MAADAIVCMATVETGTRIHIGFQNLSLANGRLYGGLGIALASPSVVVSAERADRIDCPDDLAARYASRACSLLSVPGAAVTVQQSLPRHVGLGSGTQLALGTYAAIACAYDLEPAVRSVAAELGRGGRSGIGVASFERGGLIIDGGHPVERFTEDPPDEGTWSVPPVIAHHTLPDNWRVVLAVPDDARGRHGEQETTSMQSIVTAATPEIADDIATVLTRRLLPAAATGTIHEVGDAINDIERLNGAWYADEQGGVFRPPVGTIVDRLGASDAVYGAGQSSWGPTVYGLTTADEATTAKAAAANAIDAADCSGTVHIARIAGAGSLDR